MRGAAMFVLGAIFGAMLALFVQASQPTPDDDQSDVADVVLA